MTTPRNNRKAMIRYALSASLLLAPLMIANPLGAQTPGAVLQGQVVDALEGRPLTGALVEVEGTDLYTFTGEDGQYTLAVPPGEWMLNISRDGFYPGQLVNQKSEVDRPAGTAPLFPIEAPADFDLHDSVYGSPMGTVLSEDSPQEFRLSDSWLMYTTPSQMPAKICVGRRNHDSCCKVYSKVKKKCVEYWPIASADEMDFEEYVKGVVNAEVGCFASIKGGPAVAAESWKTFAVAARSYALWYYLKNSDATCTKSSYHIDDTACNQRYKDARNADVSAAVSATAGQILVKTADKDVIDKYEYAASCGRLGTQPAYGTTLIPDATTAKACTSYCGHDKCNGHADNPDNPGSDKCLVRGICQWGSAEHSTEGDSYCDILKHYQPNLTVLPLGGQTTPCSEETEPDPDCLTRDKIIDNAKPAVGFGYWWGHGRWKTEGPPGGKYGSCSGSCPSCSYKCPNASGGTVACTKVNQTYCYGADCSGLAGKVWEVPKKVTPETDYHPYGTAAFMSDTSMWETIDPKNLERGDAMVYRKAGAGHIVIMDEKSASGGYIVYECAGCKAGCRHGTKDLSFPPYKAIRRTGLCEGSPCQNTCNKHGVRQENGTCQCYEGYAGKNCEKCAAGYTGYPFCTKEGHQCSAVASISCNDTVSGNNQGGSSSIDHYAGWCQDWDELGTEKVYEFRAPNLPGYATAELILNEGDTTTDVDVWVLKDTCDAGTCQEFGDETAYFDFLWGERYYIVVDSFAGTEGPFQLKLTCDFLNEGTSWVGDPCQDDSECNFTDPDKPSRRGYCYKAEGASFCSLPCEKYCPDMSGKAQTMCIEKKEQPGTGMCVSRAEELNDCCGNITGTAPHQKTRFKASGNGYVCVPPAK